MSERDGPKAERKKKHETFLVVSIDILGGLARGGERSKLRESKWVINPDCISLV